MNKFFSGAIGVEIPLQANTTKYYFPYIPQLVDKRIKHIEFCSGDKINVTPNGLEITASVSKNIYMTIYDSNANREVITQLPVTELNHNGNRLFINKVIDMRRSFIEIDGLNPDLENKAVYMVLMYDESNTWDVVPKVNRTSILPLEILTTGTKTLFEKNAMFIDKKIQNLILTFPTVTPKGNDGFADDEFLDKFITLKTGSLEFFQNVPLYMFYQADLYYPLRLQNIMFDLQSSYITSVNNSGKSIFFNAVIDEN